MRFLFQYGDGLTLRDRIVKDCNRQSQVEIDRNSDIQQFVVDVEGVIDVQRVQHGKSIQMVTHPDINPFPTVLNFGEQTRTGFFFFFI